MTEFLYKCSYCGREYNVNEVRYLCPVCSSDYKYGEPLKGVLLVKYDYENIKAKFDFKNPDWNLFSPVESKYYPELPVGNTPFFKAKRLSDFLDGTNIWIKNDSLNPSGSLKDRASFLVAAEARRLNINQVVTASTGNAACALSAICAAANLEAIIFAPAKAPKAKLVQILLYGAKLVLVDGTYDEAFIKSLEWTKEKGGLNRNTGYHPFTIEGKKTAGLEIFHQNGFKIPDNILIPVGDGVIITSIYKAFYDLKQAGLISHYPKLIAVQAETSNAIHNFFHTGIYSNVYNIKTIADSISVSTPSCAYLAKQALEETKGTSVLVSDDEILQAQKILASTTGVFAEPSSAAVLAGLKKLLTNNQIKREEQTVLLITGNGLKDLDSAARSIELKIG